MDLCPFPVRQAHEARTLRLDQRRELVHGVGTELARVHAEVVGVVRKRALVAILAPDLVEAAQLRLLGLGLVLPPPPVRTPHRPDERRTGTK